MSDPTYSVVIVTRNRLDALALSLPLILEQTVKPAQVVVIDSSDEPKGIRDIVDACVERYGFHIEYEHTSVPGMTRQRNIGLKRVTEPVVVYPDDDSLFYPDAMEHIMAAYTRDKTKLVAGVCGAEAAQPLEAWNLTNRSNYSMRRSDKVRRRLLPAIRFFTEKLLRDPLFISIDKSYESLEKPSALLDDNNVSVPYMTGFRMSFRTDAIRQYGFNELLGRYALGEDILASANVLDIGVLIGARQAQIYHHRAPGRRDNGRTMGIILILNRAYILAKRGYFERHSHMRFWAFYMFKLAGFLATASSAHGRAKFRGGVLGFWQARKLTNCPMDQLDDRYIKIREQLGLET